MEKTIKEPATETPVFLEADVVVVGGGPAGIGAALASSRNGAQTVLVEQRNCLGGQGTLGNVCCFMNRDYNVHSGIYEEIANELRNRNAILEDVYGHQSYEREVFKFLLENMIEEAGIKLIYRTRGVGAVKEGNTVKGVFIDTEAGRVAILAKMVIDCTRIGTIARRAGAKMLVMEKEKRLGFVTMVVHRNVDLAKLFALQNERTEYISKPWNHLSSPRGHGGKKYWPWSFMNGTKGLREAKERGEIGYDISFHGMLEPGPNRVKLLYSVADDSSGYDEEKDNWDIDGITNMELEMKKRYWDMHKYCVKHVPGFECSMVDITPFEAVTFITAVEGDYIMNEKEVFEGATHKDSVQVASWIYEAPDERRFDVCLHDIPYRCIYSKNIDNLLMGGTCISADDVAYSSIVDMPTCLNTGQAAGTAAALAVKTGVTARNLDVKLLQKTLLNQGAKAGIKWLPKEVINEYEEELNYMREDMRKKSKSAEPRIF